MTTGPGPGEIGRDRLLLRVVAGLLTAGAGALAVFLAVGFILPGTWSAERAVRVAAPAEAVFPYVDRVALWKEWTPWPDGEVRFHGPPAGVGASRSWNAPEIGAGTFTIVESRVPRLVRYRVEVEGGIHVEGLLTLEPADGGTVVTWREAGDLGWNPLLGYMARGMDRRQGAELERGLRRLADLAEQAAEAGHTAVPPREG